MSEGGTLFADFVPLVRRKLICFSPANEERPAKFSQISDVKVSAHHAERPFPNLFLRLILPYLNRENAAYGYPLTAPSRLQ